MLQDLATIWLVGCHLHGFCATSDTAGTWWNRSRGTISHDMSALNRMHERSMAWPEQCQEAVRGIHWKNIVVMSDAPTLEQKIPGTSQLTPRLYSKQ